MFLTGALFGIAKITAGIIGARVVGKGISAINERITPYEKSRTYKQIEHQAKIQREAAQKKQEYDRENMYLNHMLTREDMMINSRTSAYLSLRHSLIQDAVRNFPLNISPLVLLENNGIDVQFLLQGISSTELNQSVVKQIEAKVKNDVLSHPKSLNVFITPMHIDARVGGKEVIAAQVFDSVYSTLESVFVNEYSRNSERPVTFYSTAWKQNYRGGLHAAEELYYFLKDMPTIVIEPRFDGKNVKIMFSCWKIGYDSSIHSRQELQIPLDINSMLAIAIYERSKKALESFEHVESDSKMLNDQRSMYEHNINIFEQLNLEKRIEKRLEELEKYGSSNELDELGDYSKLLYANQNDVYGIADIISSICGMLISALADIHHLLANDIAPQFPRIYQKYFEAYAKPELLANFSKMYERTYYRLIREFPEQECLKIMEMENVKLLLGTTSIEKALTSQDVLYSLRNKCCQLGADKSKCNQWQVTKLIDYYIEHLDDDEEYRKSIILFMNSEQKKILDTKLVNL